MYSVLLDEYDRKNIGICSLSMNSILNFDTQESLVGIHTYFQ